MRSVPDHGTRVLQVIGNVPDQYADVIQGHLIPGMSSPHRAPSGPVRGRPEAQACVDGSHRSTLRTQSRPRGQRLRIVTRISSTQAHPSTDYVRSVIMCGPPPSSYIRLVLCLLQRWVGLERYVRLAEAQPSGRGYTAGPQAQGIRDHPECPHLRSRQELGEPLSFVAGHSGLASGWIHRVFDGRKLSLLRTE